MSSGHNISLFELFREEVRVHAGTLNHGLLELENDPTNAKRIEPLMRAAHSIKGAARIIGIDTAVRLAHEMEDVFVAAQEGEIRLASDDIDHLLRGTDLLAELSQITDSGATAWSAGHAEAIAGLQTVLRAMIRGEHSTSTSARATNPSGNSGDSSAGGVIALDQSSGVASLVETGDASRSAPPKPPVLTIPIEAIELGDDSAMFDLFREEVRTGSLMLQQGLIELVERACTASEVETWLQAAHEIEGAARIVDITPAAELAQSLQDALQSFGDAPGPIAFNRIEPCWRCLGKLVELIGLDQESLPGWIEREAQEIHSACKGASTAGTPATASTKPIPQSEEFDDSKQIEPPSESPSTENPPLVRKETEVQPGAITAVAPSTETAIAGETADSVVRVSAHSLNRLMGLAGESLVQARWFQPFSTALLKLKKHHDHLVSSLDNLKHAVAAGRDSGQIASLITDAHKRSTKCREILTERMGELNHHASQAEELNGRLYREAISSRMRPFSDGTHGFPRMVRDMARQLGKRIRLEINGLTTEVDRDVLEKLEAPLMHLLRNAVDHAIELPAERLAAGKSESGLIRLEAEHVAGMLAITIADDGAGMDVERLRHKVSERGFATAEMARTMSTAELLEFLFLPGFSTASVVTEYSGRGVGLDVVQQTLRRIGGIVRVTTNRGVGTMFHLQMPLTLSVLRAVLVEIVGEPYAFPHNRIDRLIRVPLSELQSLENRQFVAIDGQNIGVVVASQLMGSLDAPVFEDELTVLLLGDSSGQYGLIVDAFHGEQDLVVRPLDSRLGKVPNISAAAILDDGTPVLIADVEDLVRSMDRYIQQGALQRCSRQEVADIPKKRVLVVDDSITVREVERQILRSQGYDVTVAVDGQEGWNMVRTQTFDLVISDVDMPRMNGLELVRLIRSEPALLRMPVIIVSYKERQEDRLHGMEVGANYYLTKSSFHDNTFLQAVTDLIGKA